VARRRVGLGISRLPHRRSEHDLSGVSADERQVPPPPGLSRPSKSLDFVDECPEISIGALDARCSWYLMPWSHSVLFVRRNNFKTTAPLLLKNPSDLGVNSSATIEPAGRDLGRTAGPMGASAEAGGEGTDVTDATSTDGLRWLRPRASRSDNAGRRPPEMRRSRQLKALGCAERSDNLCLATDVFCSCDNSENNKTTRDRLVEDDYMVKTLATG
jgi:hypothetical protein